MGSLSEVLPKRLYTTRLSLELFDHSDEHYECFFASMNSKLAHATMGDYGIHTRQQFHDLCRATRLYPQVCEGRNVDTEIIYLARLKKDHKPLIGIVTLAQRSQDVAPDMGWAMLEEYTGNGYAPEAGKELLRLCQDDLGIKEIIAWPGESNQASIRTAQKIGFIDGGSILSEDDTKKVVYILPGMQFNNDIVLSFWGDREKEAESENSRIENN